jgi:hypothetical protein
MTNHSRNVVSGVLYNAGMTYKKIAAAFDVSESTISNSLKASGFKPSLDRPATEEQTFTRVVKIFITLLKLRILLKSSRENAPSIIRASLGELLGEDANEEVLEQLKKGVSIMVDTHTIVQLLQGSYIALCLQSKSVLEKEEEKRIMKQLWAKHGPVKEYLFPTTYWGEEDSYSGIRAYGFMEHAHKVCSRFVHLVLAGDSTEIEKAVSFEDLCLKITEHFISETLAEDYLTAFGTVSSSKQFSLSDAMKELSEREREIVSHYYGIGTKPLSLEDIGTMFNVTRERARQIKDKATQSLRSGFRKTGRSFPIEE